MVCVLSGPEHLFEFVNEAHIRTLGFDATGQTVREAQPESVELHGILDEVYRSGVTAFLHEIPVTVGTRLRHFNLTYAARRCIEGQVNGVMILGSEVTEQVAAHRAIIEAKEAADEANRAKSAFLAHLSHELRTPLGVIAGFCELLGDQGIDEVERQHFLSKIASNTQSLSRLVDDILDLSKVEAGKLRIEERAFSLAQLLEESLDFFKEKADAKGIELSLTLDENFPDLIASDAARIKQILINIIGNALKFTSRGGIAVQGSYQSEGSQRPRLKVKIIDSGIGMSPEAAQQIFQPFVQAHQGIKRRFGGSGLGLVISRKLAEALGAELLLESHEEGKGCTFALHFHEGLVVQAPEPRYPSGHARPREKEQRLAGRHILLVEDTVDNQLLISRMLGKFGGRISIAQDGEEAVTMALQGDYDLVLMDLQMPRVDGYEATRRLRHAGFKVPIVALTAHAMDEDRQKTKLAGCNAHLSKPINLEDLLRTIDMLLKVPALGLASIRVKRGEESRPHLR